MIYPHNFEHKIGFDQIRQLLKGRCLSTLGEERVDEMTYGSRYADINQQLDLTCEMLAILQGDDDFILLLPILTCVSWQETSWFSQN